MIVAIVQARMGSSRLPGKVLMEIVGKPALWHLVNRLSKSRLIDKIVIATSDREEDKSILKLAQDLGVGSFAGSATEVLDRYYQAARKYNAETIVRVTADCPLIDPELVDKIIGIYVDSKGELDYVSKGQSYPDGLDVEVFSFNALEKAWKEAKKKSQRGEYVTTYIWGNPHLFKTLIVENEVNLSHMRWTVDYERDLILVREIFKNLYKEGEVFHLRDILEFLDKHPELAELNSDLINPEYLKSVLKEE